MLRDFRLSVGDIAGNRMDDTLCILVLFLRNTTDLVFFRCATLKSSAALASLQRHAMAAHFGPAVWEKPVKKYNALPVFSVDYVLDQIG